MTLPTSATSSPCRTWSWSPSKTPTRVSSRDEQLEVGNPPTFTNYRKMLATTGPDFVLALGRHRQMAAIAHDLLDQGYPFLMEKPMGINAPEGAGVAAKAARLNAFVAVPLAQRYASFAMRARELLAAGRFGP